ncbi:MarR family winged helix-turn-helix transcriptional regulator [Isoptericola sp. F-RaC21]|uniref:MarR family winged helix-turn-helix transcriptional regulator n=1 Tax=Isoptericola sp. F-RaC21 TaxID=3141452 RepID=UPI00315B450E
MADTTGELTGDDRELWERWTRAQRLLASEVDRRLQTRCGVSKAEFSVLVTLFRAPDEELRVVDIAETLDWDKSRVAHQLTRMESRALVDRVESGARGRRTGVRLAPEGRRLTAEATAVHARALREVFFDVASPAQLRAIDSWSSAMISRAGAPARDDDA